MKTICPECKKSVAVTRTPSRDYKGGPRRYEQRDVVAKHGEQLMHRRLNARGEPVGAIRPGFSQMCAGSGKPVPTTVVLDEVA
jgi:hypothetical protein